MLERKEKDGRFDEDGREEAETLVLLDEGSKSKIMFEEPTKEDGMWSKKEELEREKIDPPASKEDGRKLTGGPKRWRGSSSAWAEEEPRVPTCSSLSSLRP